jgi:hypothetical protein
MGRKEANQHAEDIRDAGGTAHTVHKRVRSMILASWEGEPSAVLRDAEAVERFILPRRLALRLRWGVEGREIGE